MSVLFRASELLRRQQAARGRTVIAVIKPSLPAPLTPKLVIELEAQARRDAKRRVHSFPVVAAPVAGVLQIDSQTGTKVKKGEVVGRVVNPTQWLLTAVFRPPGPTLTSRCEVSSAMGDSASCTVKEIAPQGASFEVTVTVNGEARWLGESAEVQIAIQE